MAGHSLLVTCHQRYVAVALFSMLLADDVLSCFNATGVEIGSGTAGSWRVMGYTFCVPK